MKKVIILIIILCWFGSGLLGFGLTNGYFYGRFGPEDQSNKFIPDLDHYIMMFFSSCFGPLNLMATLLFLGNNKDMWQYPMRFKL